MRGTGLDRHVAAALFAVAGLLAVAGPAHAGAPIVSYQLYGTTGQAGWFVSNVSVAWQVQWNGSPPVSSEGCEPGDSLKADTTPAGIKRTCTASNEDGTSSVTTSAIRKDATKPAVTSAAPSRPPDRDGWFNHPLEVSFAGSDAASGVASCSAPAYSAPDTASGSVSGTCRDAAGNLSALGSFALKYDATPPEVTALTPERPADFLGYFVRPVALTFSGADQTSGLQSCDTVLYAGPDSASAAVSGACRDVAGNAAARTMAVAFDATAPALSKVSAVAGDSVATVSWDANDDASAIRVTRSPGPARPVFDGNAARFEDRGLRNGVRYRYTVTAVDAAGHQTARAVTASPSAKLIAPAAGATVKRPPRLSWKRVAKARYYNVQLFRGKRKILSAWPRNTRLQLQSAWRYSARWQRLTPGTYRWYVWPGYGDRPQRRYGRALGSRTFTMP